MNELLKKYDELHKAKLIQHKDMWQALGYNNETQFWCVRHGKRGMSIDRIVKFEKIVNKLYKQLEK